MFQMYPSKSTGLDGISPIFYKKKRRDIMGMDVTNACLNFLNSEKIPSILNHTHIVLIPKCEHPTKIVDFFPISLCNILYKIISKVLANRLKGCYLILYLSAKVFLSQIRILLIMLL